MEWNHKMGDFRVELWIYQGANWDFTSKPWWFHRIEWDLNNKRGELDQISYW